MNIKIKAALVAIPLAFLMQGIVLLCGFWLYGENLHVPATNIGGVIIGGVAYCQVLKYLERKQNTDKVS